MRPTWIAALLAAAVTMAMVTAASAGAGWYFMMPPGGTHPQPPLSQWEQRGAFDTVNECKEVQGRLWLESEGRALSGEPCLLRGYKGTHPDQAELWAELVRKMAGKNLTEAGVCVSTDDPRLKP